MTDATTAAMEPMTGALLQHIEALPAGEAKAELLTLAPYLPENFESAFY